MECLSLIGKDPCCLERSGVVSKVKGSLIKVSCVQAVCALAAARRTSTVEGKCCYQRLSSCLLSHRTYYLLEVRMTVVRNGAKRVRLNSCYSNGMPMPAHHYSLQS